MKSIKLKILMVLSILISQFGFATSVFAAATCTVGFSSNSTVPINENITVSMYVSNISGTNGGITSVGGFLDFDSSYLEYVSGTISSSYLGDINPSNHKVGILMLASKIQNNASQTTIATFVFKAKKAGTTTITITTPDASDNSGVFTPNLGPKQITITDGNSGGGNTGGNTGGDNPGGNTGGETTQKSSDATLKSLGASGYDLSPSFSPNQTSYTVTVPKDATKATLTGAANSSKAKVEGLGEVILTGDETTATITVTAEDGTKKTYTVKIVKDNSSSGSQETENEDATLKSLEVEGQTLNPSFKSNVNTYSVKVKNDVTSLDITAIPTDPEATVEISSNANNLKEGMNTVTIKVTTKSGKTNVYTINIERSSSSNSGSNSGSKTTAAQKSSDNTLSSLVIGSSHDIDKNFDKNITSYNITVPYEVDKLNLSAVASSSKAKVQITGNENFKVGQVNVVTITVTAEDGSQRIYILNVTRSTLTSETDLGSLVVKEGISPSFTPDNLEYFTEVGSDVDHLDITAIPKSKDSIVEIIGNSNLKEGDNTIFIKVTDKNGFSKIYKINVKKAAPASKKIFGLTPFEFGMLLGLLGLLFLLLFLIFLFLKRKKKEEEPPVQPAPTSPVIDFKPEFNFGSRNGTDDDIVYPNATFNQGNTTNEVQPLPKKELHELDYTEAKEVPYDMYDEIVTKDELIDAIEEGLETKNPEKLRMLLEQEQLNRKKEELKKRDQERR